MCIVNNINKQEINTKRWSAYMHISPSGKKYVGITSQDVERRWRNGNGYSNNIAFTRAIKKYGWDSFIHKIIADNLSYKEACNTEVEMISSLQLMNKKYGYNLTSGGEGTKNHVVTDATRKILSKKATGKNNPNFGRTGEKHPLYGITKGNSHSAKKVVCLNTMETFDSIIEAGDAMKCLASTISSCCTGVTKTRKTCGKHPITGERLVWAFFKDVENMNKEEIIEHISNNQKPSKGNKKKIVQLGLDGEFIKEWNSGREASKNLNINNKIPEVCKGKRKTAGGFKWMYKEDYDKMVSYSNKHIS